MKEHSMRSWNLGFLFSRLLTQLSISIVQSVTVILEKKISFILFHSLVKPMSKTIVLTIH